jgi:excisionase family DNA binding protein
MTRDFYTPSEAAKVLRVPQRRILEWLDAGQIEAQRDPRTGRWKIPRGSLNVSETERLTELLTEEQLARLQTTEEALSGLEEHARSLREERDRLREERDRLEAALEAERSKGFWRRMFGG